MEQIPVLVDELGVARLQNAVYVGLMKFTLDQMNQNRRGRFFALQSEASSSAVIKFHRF